MGSQERNAIFLDRDGTLIVDKMYLNDPEQVEYLNESERGLQMLRDQGFIFLIATNQSGLPRNLVTIDQLHAIHKKIKSHYSSFGVDILEFYYAPYLTHLDHPMRKPNPGMILTGAVDYSVDLACSWMIGDKWVDIEAGQRAGCKTILIANKSKDLSGWTSQPTAICENLLQAAEFIVSVTQPENGRT